MPLHPNTRESLIAAIPQATARGRKALEDWDAVSDSLCDETGEPLDEEAFNLRQHQRDAEAWNAFEPFIHHGPQLLEDLKEDFLALHQEIKTPDIATIHRRRSQLSQLSQAFEGGRRVDDGWEFAREIILTDSPEGEELLRRSEWLRNREGWHYAIAFADNADILVEIDQAARPRPESGRTRTAAQAKAARARSTTTASPSPSPPADGRSAPPAQPGPEHTRRTR